MQCSRRVLSGRNGNWNAQVVFVAEAPGRLGAEVTGVPLFGDRTGDRFDELLSSMNWMRSEIFITNAVLCNPRDAKGNNDVPARIEVENCSVWLVRTLQVIKPRLVIALGRVALDALRAVHRHDCKLSESVGKVYEWGGTHLGVLYHPGPRSQVHRAWLQQVVDAKTIGEYAERNLRITPFVNIAGRQTSPAMDATLSSSCEFD